MAENIQKRNETKKKIKDAVMLLYAKDGLYKLTISGVCKEAGLHRSTFYLYYETIDEVIQEVEKELLDTMYQYSAMADYTKEHTTGMSQNEILEESRGILTDYFEWLFSVRDYLNSLLSEDGDIRFLSAFELHIRDSFVHIMEQFHLQTDNEYYLDYIVGGTFRNLVSWLKKGSMNAKDLVEIHLHMFLQDLI